MLLLIEDKEGKRGGRVTCPDTTAITANRIGIHVKKTFISKHWREETMIFDVRNDYNDGIKCVVKDMVLDLNKKL